MLSDGNLRLEKLGGGDGRTEGRTYGNSPLCPFGASAQKERETKGETKMHSSLAGDLYESEDMKGKKRQKIPMAIG